MGAKKSLNPLTIVVTADDRYAMQMSVTVSSALTNLSGHGKCIVYVFDGGIEPENRRRFERVIASFERDVELRWVKPDMSSISRLRRQHAMTTAVYLRLLLSEVLGRDIKRVIYLDSDLVVLGDLYEIWRTNLHGNVLCGVQDYGVPYASSDYGIVEYKRLGIARGTPYFNSGVLMIDVEEWKRQDIAARCLKYLKEYREKLHFHDQEALNAVIKGQWVQLPLEWNVAPVNILAYPNWEDSPFKREMGRRFDEILSNTKIMHFCGSPKPWNPNQRIYGEHLFLEALAESAWFTPQEWARWRLSLYSQKMRAFKQAS